MLMTVKINKHRLAMLGWVLALLLSSASVGAQENRTDKSPPDPQRREGRQRDEHGRGPGPGPGFNFVGAEMRFGGKTVKGAPYSATAVSETTQTLGDATKSTRKTPAAVYGDSEGRTRKEQTLSNIAPFAPGACGLRCHGRPP